MKRREFITSSVAATTAAAVAPALMSQGAEAGKAPAREFYELRLYHLRRGPLVKRFDDFYKDVAVPAWNRAGVGTVGVFDVFIGPDNPTKYVLLPFASLDAMNAAHERFEADAEVQKAEFTNVPATDQSYTRKQSSLMRAFAGLPKLEVPPQTAEKKPRIFEVRTYEAHSRKANRKKVEMFDTGEIALFRRTGLRPVFFGETIIGTKLPQLTYMLSFADMVEREKNWATFIADPEWKKMSSTPGFTDPEILTNINSVFLRPTAYSQI
jgi:NIPSNAP